MPDTSAFDIIHIGALIVAGGAIGGLAHSLNRFAYWPHWHVKHKELLIPIIIISSASLLESALSADNDKNHVVPNISQQQFNYYENQRKSAEDRMKDLSTEAIPKSDSAIVAAQNGIRSEGLSLRLRAYNG